MECHFDRVKKTVACMNLSSALLTALALLFLSNGVTPALTIFTVLAIQVFAVFKDSTDIAKKRWALRYYLQDSNRLIGSMEQEFRTIQQGATTDEGIVDRVYFYETEFSTLRGRYLDSMLFLDNHKFISKANEKADNELKVRHSLMEFSHGQ
jgi:hypothetical protein